MSTSAVKKSLYTKIELNVQLKKLSNGIEQMCRKLSLKLVRRRNSTGEGDKGKSFHGLCPAN